MSATAVDLYDNVSSSTRLADLLLNKYVRNGGYHDINGDGYGDLILTISGEPGKAFQGSANWGDPRFSQVEWMDPWVDEFGRPAAGGCGILFADFDNDGDLDFYVPNPNGHQLFQYDQSQSKYLDVTSSMGLEFTGSSEIYNHTINAAWGDFDGDTYVDLLLIQGTDDSAGTNGTVGSDHQMLLKNDGGTGFYDSELCNNGAGVGFQSSTRVVSALWVDFESDNDLDLILLQGAYYYEDETSVYLENENAGGLYFTKQDSKIAACMEEFNHKTNCAAPADMNNDGLMDIVFCNNYHYGIFLADETGMMSEAWISDRPPTNMPFVWDLAAFDADLNGMNDMLVSQYNEDQQRPRLFMGCLDPTTSEPRFDQIYPTEPTCGSQYFEPDHGNDQRGLCAADFVQDGQTEFYMSRTVTDVNNGEFFWDIYDGPGSWVGFELSAPHGMCNRAAIGATAVVSYDDGVDLHRQAKLVDGGSGRASQSDLRLAYGMGSWSGPVDLEVHLPNRGIVPGGQTVYLSVIPTGQYWDFEVDGLVNDSVATSFIHDLQTGDLTLTVTWETYDSTTAADDRLTFYVDGFPDAQDPGQRIWTGGDPIIALPTGRYQHELSISGLDCDTSLKFYFSLQSQMNDKLYGSSIHVRGPKKCIVQDPPPYDPGIE